mmetsp:Transcript_343/g.584  ORF Transcript_343/g.584 Transcript_343/m.584 type:complete len:232 (-) Transcript_343:733-1428(-)
MDGHTILVTHLVELVDAHDAAVRQHHGTRLQAALARLTVLSHRRRQTHATGPAPRRADGQGGHAHDGADELGLSDGGVADHEHVDVAAEMGAVGEILLVPAQQLQDQRLLDHVVPEDGRRQRVSHHIEEVLSLFEFGDVGHVLARERGGLHLLRQLAHGVAYHDGAEHPGRGPFGAVRDGFEHAHDLHAVARLDIVHELVLHDQLHGAGELPGGGVLGHLLKRDRLMVTVH